MNYQTIHKNNTKTKTNTNTKTKKIYIKRDVPFELYEINLRIATDDELLKISEDNGLALNLDEMKTIKDYFVGKNRNPTDVELQSIAQAWSEHCCYKSSKPILAKFIFPISASCVIAKGDAGVVEFDDEHAYALRIESHNHPSAVEPYGGAATGIGGIVRDILAMGAQPIALVDPLYFGPLEYPYEKLPKGVKHPKYLFSGVVAGIRDYGNRIGIPTVSGCVYFDEGYIGNCIVNVGCVGIVKKRKILRNFVKNVGDILILVGGKTGRDGIHGVTFASRILSEKSEEEDRGAVQLGDPIMKEPVIHACIECNDKNLLNGLKDLGGGGLSCVVGEMVYSAGLGAEVHLDRVPLKEEGLAPWEIWVSESQERMMVSVSPENVEETIKIFELYDVPATPIGKVIPEKVVRLFYNKILVFELETEFLTKGPVYNRPYVIPTITTKTKKDEKILPEADNYNDVLLSLLASPNIANKDWVIRQYDHEVRGCTVIKPLQGVPESQTHGDAVVLKPLVDSWRGLAITTATNPSVTSINPFIGGKTIIDEMCRNLAAVGARPQSLTNCLNFGNPEVPERLGEFYETVRGIGYVTQKLGLAIPSGNVSFYNETSDSVVPPTASILGVGIVKDIRKCVTSDFKRSCNTIYLVGKTTPELGGSEYYRVFSGYTSKVPDVNVSLLKKSINKMVSAIENGHIVACHDISHGGLAVCIAEMCIGGNVGAEIDLSNIGKLSTDAKLFSESNTRWIVEVNKRKEFELRGIPITKIGVIKGNRLKIEDKDNTNNNNKKLVIDLSLSEIRARWNNKIWSLMG